MPGLNAVFEFSDEMSPIAFERYVRDVLANMGADLQSISVVHREKLKGLDGTYEIDVSVRFTSLGLDFLILCECKHQKTSVERAEVQVLHDRMRSIGAQKGVLFSSAPFQSGAIEYADVHKIALVKVSPDSWSYIRKGYLQSYPSSSECSEDDLLVGYLTTIGDKGNPHFSIVNARYPEYLREFFGFDAEAGAS